MRWWKNDKYLGKEETLLDLLKISQLMAINTNWCFSKQALVILQELQPDACKESFIQIAWKTFTQIKGVRIPNSKEKCGNCI